MKCVFMTVNGLVIITVILVAVNVVKHEYKWLYCCNIYFDNART